MYSYVGIGSSIRTAFVWAGNYVAGVCFLSRWKDDPLKVRKAVIPAAGLGTRFLPATKAQPKEMLPIVDTPSIQYVVEEAVRSGLTDILIITGRGKRSIEDHFDRSAELKQFLDSKGKFDELKQVREIAEMASIHYVRQKEA